MSSENPYRAAGTFSGPAYTERSADRELRRAVDHNQRYPYMLAPRQSGKSSLLYRLRTDLDPDVFRCGFVDFSIFRTAELLDYDTFLGRLFAELVHTLRVPEIALTGQPKKDLRVLLAPVQEPRVLLLLDEIDAVRSSPFKNVFFSDIRNIFNDRADPNQKELKRVQFVLAGAARVEELITDSARSPFNVGKSIRLNDFTLEEVRSLCCHLDASGATAYPLGLPERLFDLAGGSVYLTQLLLERLWDSLGIDGWKRVSRQAILERVDTLTDQIVTEAAQNIHFSNIAHLLKCDSEALKLWRQAIFGTTLSETQLDRLRATGVTGFDPKAVYRNNIYARVFGRNGPLALLVEALCWNIPNRNPIFTGRESELAQLQKALASRGRAALSGLRGAGKTETALEFAHRHLYQYTYIFWASAHSREALISAYQAMGNLLRLPESNEDDQMVRVHAVRRWLGSQDGWLLILDNAVDLRTAREFVPPGDNGHVILIMRTNRARAVDAMAPLIEIQQMGTQEAALLLLRRAKLIGENATADSASEADRAIAIQIAKLDGLPLALDQAAAYIKESGCGLSGYLDFYRKLGPEFLRRRYEANLALLERTLGPGHLDVADSVNDLAGLYNNQGQYAKAELLYKRALVIYEKALGPEDRTVAICLENYARLMRNTGRAKEAADLESRARVIRAKHALDI